jgi:hypothetical protein
MWPSSHSSDGHIGYNQRPGHGPGARTLRIWGRAGNDRDIPRTARVARRRIGTGDAGIGPARCWRSVLGLIYRRYLGVLGADRRKPAERQAYDALRASLAEGNLAARLYAERLTRFLNWVGQFFGDAGVADRTLFPRAFRLKMPAHLWTAPAFDRCLFLALLYPITSICTIWAVSGHAGLAEAALHLRPAPSGWERALVMLLAAGCAFAMFRRRPVAEVTGWRSLLSFIIFVMLVALLVAGGVAKLDPIVVPVVLLGAVVAPDAVARNGAAVFAFGFAFAVFGAFVGNAAEIIVLTGFAAGILTLSSAAAVAVLSNLAAR